MVGVGDAADECEETSGFLLSLPGLFFNEVCEVLTADCEGKEGSEDCLVEFSIRVVVKLDVACYRDRASGLAAEDSLMEGCHCL